MVSQWFVAVYGDVSAKGGGQRRRNTGREET